jgi:hypothetical protein
MADKAESDNFQPEIGKIYNSKGHGTVRFVEMDFEDGEPIYHFDTKRGIRYMKRVHMLHDIEHPAGGVQALSAGPTISRIREYLQNVESGCGRMSADIRGLLRALENDEASPTPPAEQPAQPGAVYAELPEPALQSTQCDSTMRYTTLSSFSAEQLRDFADRTHALRQARTALPDGWTACTIEFGNDGPEEVAYGPQVLMTRLAKWLTKHFERVIADAAPKAAPGEPLTRRFGGCPSCGRSDCVAMSCTRSEDKEMLRFVANVAPQPAAPQAAPAVDAKDAALWREHRDKLDALVTYCPTCCQGFATKKELTRDEIIFECGKSVGRSKVAPQAAPVVDEQMRKDAERWRSVEAMVSEVHGGDEFMVIELSARAKPEQHLKTLLVDKVAALAAQKGTP